MNFPAQAGVGKIDSKALTNGEPLFTSAWCGTRPMTAAVTSTYRTALAAVPSSEARPTFCRGSFTRFAVIAAASTPMNENSATPAAIPIPL